MSKVGSDLPFVGDPMSLYNQDPMLASPPSDLSPSLGSPLLGKGTPVSFVTDNAKGACISGSLDIGAF